jgi:choice-of-anchor B domain-containing protein
MRVPVLLLLLVSFKPAIGQDIKNIALLDNWMDTSFAAGPENIRFNDVSGFTQHGIHYAIIGSSQGTHILTIENRQLVPADFVPGKYQHALVEHRDYAVYKNYLYAVCDEGTSSLQIIDLSFLPDSVSVVYDSNALFQTAHTVFADTNKARLYVCGANNSAMKILDISDPVNPLPALDFSAVSYVHDCFVVNDTAFLNCGFDGLHIYNFSGPVPVQLGVLDFYAGQGYNHSGYVSASGNQYAFTDETESTKIKLCKLDDLSNISVNEQFGTADFDEHIPHNVVLLEKLAVCSYYNEGLRIFDLSDQPIREIAAYDTYTAASDFKMNGAWGVFVFESDNLILISDRQGGLFLFWFPLVLLEHGTEGTFVSNTPFIDENSILIARDFLGNDNLSFSVFNSAGQVVYEQEDYRNWVNIPLSLPAGYYIYSVYDANQNILESGPFVKAN